MRESDRESFDQHSESRFDFRKKLVSATISSTRTARRLGIAAYQAWRVHQRTPRLPEALGRDGVATTVRTERSTKTVRSPATTGLEPDSPHAYHVVVVGDSVAAGVGLDHHRNSVAGRLASALSERYGHPVAWHVVARTGADARAVLHLTQQPDHAGRIATCDVVLVSVGVNDVLAPRSASSWRRALGELLTHLTQLNPTAPIVLLGVPPIAGFPAMPTTLGDVLGRRAERFDDIALEVAGELPNVHHLSLADPTLSLEKGFAEDGFHPSAKLHKRIAKRADKRVALTSQEDSPEEALPRPTDGVL